MGPADGDGDVDNDGDDDGDEDADDDGGRTEVKRHTQQQKEKAPTSSTSRQRFLPQITCAT